MYVNNRYLNASVKQYIYKCMAKQFLLKLLPHEYKLVVSWLRPPAIWLKGRRGESLVLFITLGGNTFECLIFF